MFATVKSDLRVRLLNMENEYILSVDNLCKTYPSFYLDHVSFKVKKGTIMGFIGRNGAGKTTTLKSLVNLIRKDSGTVEMFNNDFFLNETQDKQRLSFLLGGIDYYQRTKIKNLTSVTRRFYKNWDENKYQHYLKAFELDENKSIKQLSNGMKMKYQLAVNLSHNAELLIFDEPTSGLDPVSRDELLDLFLKIVSDGSRSILFSTHITSDLEKCADDITYISKGKILLSLPEKEFISSFTKFTGKKEDLDEKTEKSAMSIKEFKGNIEGVCWAKDKTENNMLRYEKPTLEDIMVFYERSQEENEESII